MKAQTFLEYCKDRQLGIRDIYSLLDTKDIETINEISKAINFYSQPFKPELITELFVCEDGDEWVKETKDLAEEGNPESYMTEIYDDGYAKIQFDWMSGCMQINSEVPAPIHDEPSNTATASINTYIPLTLNEFIMLAVTQCQV